MSVRTGSFLDYLFQPKIIAASEGRLCSDVYYRSVISSDGIVENMKHIYNKRVPSLGRDEGATVHLEL